MTQRLMIMMSNAGAATLARLKPFALADGKTHLIPADVLTDGTKLTDEERVLLEALPRETFGGPFPQDDDSSEE